MKKLEYVIYFIVIICILLSIRTLSIVNLISKNSFRKTTSSSSSLLLYQKRPISGRLAWCIPVGGKTHRLKLLKQIVKPTQ